MGHSSDSKGKVNFPIPPLKAASSPRYAAPTISASITWSDREQEAVRNAFLSANFIQIRDLPLDSRSDLETSSRGISRDTSTSDAGLSVLFRSSLVSFGKPTSNNTAHHASSVLFPVERGAPSRRSSRRKSTSKSLSGVSVSWRQLGSDETSYGTLPVTDKFPSPRVFSRYGSASSEFDREAELQSMRRIQSEEQRRLIDSDKEFAIRKAESGVPSDLAFSKFEYGAGEYVPPSVDEDLFRRSVGRSTFPPFVAGSDGDSKSPLMKSRRLVKEAVQRLHNLVHARWPMALSDVTSDSDGAILVAFHRSEWSPELHSYMSTLALTSAVCTEYGLHKDGECWGSGLDGAVFYALQPPWAPKLRGRVPSLQSRRSTRQEANGGVTSRAGSTTSRSWSRDRLGSSHRGSDPDLTDRAAMTSRPPEAATSPSASSTWSHVARARQRSRDLLANFGLSPRARHVAVTSRRPPQVSDQSSSHTAQPRLDPHPPQTLQPRSGSVRDLVTRLGRPMGTADNNLAIVPVRRGSMTSRVHTSPRRHVIQPGRLPPAIPPALDSGRLLSFPKTQIGLSHWMPIVVY